MVEHPDSFATHRATRPWVFEATDFVVMNGATDSPVSDTVVCRA